MKWAFGAVAAVVGTLLVLPGTVSAHHPKYGEEISCDDGSFEQSLSYIGGPGNRILIVEVEGDRLSEANDYDEFGLEFELGDDVTFTNDTNNEDFNYSPSRDRFEVDGHPLWVEDKRDETWYNPDFFQVYGNYDDVDAADDDSIDVNVDMYGATNDGVLDGQILGDYDNPFLGSTGGSVTTDEFWTNCGTEVCVNGSSADTLSFDPLDSTNDCGFKNYCVGGTNGEVERMTEFEANNDPNVAAGPCSFENEEEDEEEVIEEIDEEPELELVSEVSPAVEEVLPTALPAAGQGPTSEGNLTLFAMIAAALVGFGVLTAAVARKV